MRIKILLSISAILIFTIFLIQKENMITIILADGREIIAEIADDDEERQEGLMFREELAENAGMFFIFPEEKELSFWMKNTLIPLDIIFLDKDLKILNIEKAEPCEKDPCPRYESDTPAMYVLEINQISDENYEGDSIKLK